MRVFGMQSLSIRIGNVLDGLLVIVVFLVAAEVLLALGLLTDPQHPLRERFQVTTLSRVGPAIWPTDGLVRIADGSATAAVEPWVRIALSPSSRGFVLIAASASLAWWACLITVLLQLRGLLGNLSKGTPFPRDNIRRIRIMGWAIVGTAAVELLMDAGLLMYMSANITVAGRPAVVPPEMLMVDFPLGTILGGLAVILLAEIFSAGADLQDEQALTI